ncbi:hypothetical protein Dda_8823 [Drechslerella dactyloides]|uniref:Ankyrin repeat protein n=1 Tax=Drechslerella dactyloides TaxID=74499 RepID=A0AAD6IQ13_DREDA|nr:hypothetical protein Dda_8823 [Drechslerella dactyloides]
MSRLAACRIYPPTRIQPHTTTRNFQSLPAMSSPFPTLPADPGSFLSFVGENEDKPLRELVKPYLEYESKLRGLFAQDPSHPDIVNNNIVGLVPIYDGHDDRIKIRSRDLSLESQEEQDHYIMPLREKERKASGERAIVDHETFLKNFNIFTEGSLKNLDWSHIVAAGSSVMTPILAVPEEDAKDDDTLSHYYHSKFAPVSDIDLFIYGTKDESVAIKRMEAVEKTIAKNLGKKNVLSIRTKNTVTIVSEYPNRHIQIVLRLYSSISEILTGFDVSCACVAYNGEQVFANPRAIVSWMLQCNDIDLSRRSPSYEFRLAKYRKRGFEIYYSALDRKVIDPTIYERSMRGRGLHLKGLAKLLVLERLPTETERENYLDMRRRERGRPNRKRPRRERRVLKGDMKADGGEVPDWGIATEVSEESMYETISIPYGPRFNAEKIKKLLFQTDMFLNSEWNKRVQKRRGPYLHRHPAFFGTLKYIVNDCCGFCPEPDPNNKDAMELRAKDDRYYIHGNMSFIKDDPGRQEIGSFNPITDEDWTEMAYLSINEVLCRAIVANDPDAVKSFISEGGDVNKRDYTGRTPLHLAVLASNIDIIRLLLDGGARLTPRLFDGRTVLHIATARGDIEICRLLLLKNQQNEMEKEKRDEEREARKAADAAKETTDKDAMDVDKPEKGTADRDTMDVDMPDRESVDKSAVSQEMGDIGGSDKAEKPEKSEDGDSVTGESDGDEDISIVSNGEMSVSARTGASGFVDVNVRKQSEDPELGEVEEEETVQDDVLDINKTDWDYQLSPLHYAIIHGHQEIVVLLVSDFGADILQPVVTSYNGRGVPDAVLLPISLVFRIPEPKERPSMLRTLLKLGASSAQTDLEGATAVMRVIQRNDLECLKVMFEEDSASARAAVHNIHIQYGDRASNALIVALSQNNEEMAAFLLENGAAPEISIEAYVKATKCDDQQRNRYLYNGVQPAEIALEMDMPDIFTKCIELGVDPSSYTSSSIPTEGLNIGYLSQWGRRYLTLLDLVDKKVESFKSALDTLPDPTKDKEKQLTEKEKQEKQEKLEKLKAKVKKMVSIPEEYEEGSYEYWMAAQIIKDENDRRKAHNDRLGIPKAEDSDLDDVSDLDDAPGGLFGGFGMRPTPPAKKSDDDPEKVELKKTKLEALLKRYNELADMLISKGGKRFKELHPDIWDRVFKKPDTQLPDPFSRPPEKTAESAPAEDTFKVSFDFELQTNKKLDPKINTAYQELYKALWNGDKEALRRYTTTNWEENMPPLLIGVNNQLGYTPLSIAVYRKHPREFLDLILTITQAQYERDTSYKKKKQEDKIYRLHADGEVDFYVEEIDFTEVKLTRSLGDNEEEDIDDTVKASMDAVRMLRYGVPYLLGNPMEKPTHERERLLEQTAMIGDTEVAEYITSRIETLEGPTLTPGTWTPQLRDNDLINILIRDGRTEILRDFMEKYGLGALFDGNNNFKYDDTDYEAETDSEAESVEEEEEVVKPEKTEKKKMPKQYPGLSIDGKKKKDWVNLMNPNYCGPPRLHYEYPPLALFAAYHGSRKFYEWLETSGPHDALRKWQAKLERGKDAKKSYFVKVLQAADEEKVNQWMGVDHALLIPAAIKNSSVAKNKDLSAEDKFAWYRENAEFFVTRNPEHLESKKNRKGFTPLLLAASELNKYALKALLDLGADAYAKTPEGNFNIIHVMLKNFVNPYSFYHWHQSAKKGTWADLRDCLDLLPDDVKKWAFCHRATENNILYTPLSWALANLNSTQDAKIFNLLLKYSNGADTRVRTSLGDLPIHTIVKKPTLEILQCILDASPLEVSLMEDTNGMTALELAIIAWYTETALKQESGLFYPWSSYSWQSTAIAMSTTKDKPSKTKPDDEYDVQLRKKDWGIKSRDRTTVRTMKMLKVALQKGIDGGVGMRSLVPLRDVNETAERLASRNKSSSLWYWSEGGSYDDIVNIW